MQILSSPYQISRRLFYSPQSSPIQPSKINYSPLIARIRCAVLNLNRSNLFKLRTSQPLLLIKHKSWLLKCFDNENEHSSYQGSILTEAQEAVSELLQECGASREDAANIVSNCKKYLEMLVDSVRELDEHSLWSSWSNEIESEGEADIGNFGFKKKIYHMAKSKGDGGILPFLESAGVKYSSAILIARYMSTEKLPDLIIKVRFLKDLLFASRSHEVLIGRNARRMMKHLSISIDDDIQRTLSFFEKLEAKHGGLNSLGYNDDAFSYLVESFRKLLLLSVDNHLEPLVTFLQQFGISTISARIIFLLFPPILLYDVENITKPRILAMKKAGIEDKDIGRMLLKYPWILSTSIQENYENILKFFQDRKVPKYSVIMAIKSWPHLLGSSTKKMEVILDEIDKLGIDGKMLVPIITSSPQLLLRKPSEFLQVVSFVKEFGFDDKTTGRILCRSPEVFAANVDNNLKKKVKYLMDFGILGNQLPRIIRKYPELLLLDFHRTLLPRLRYLMQNGLSKRNVCSMVFRFSPILGYSIDLVLKPKLEFFINTIQRPYTELVEYPRYFSYSLEEKIKYRFMILESKNVKCSLIDMLAKNDYKFAKQYSLPLPSSSSKNDDTYLEVD